MSPLILSFVLALVIAAGLVMLAVYANRIRRINVVFARLAERFGGQLSRAGFWRHPSVRFRHEGQLVEVSTEPTNADPEIVHTVFRSTWPDPDLFLEVYPTHLFTGIVRLFGGHHILTGARDFDGQYYARGSDVERGRGILGPGVQYQIEQLRCLTAHRDFHLMIAEGQLVVRKRGILFESPRLARFTSLGLALVEQALLTNMAGIEILAERVAPAGGQATCRICGDSIGADIVYCRVCRTPHHHECWLYNGSCSIYGCGGKRYVTGRRARRVVAR